METSTKFLDAYPTPTASTRIPHLSYTTRLVHGDGNIHGAIYGFGAWSLAIITITTIIRLFTKMYVLKLRRVDDFLMIGSWCGLVCIWAFMYVSVRYGAGEHLDTVSHYNEQRFLKYGYLHEVFYAVTQGLLKTSICLQLLHIFVAHLSSRAKHHDWKFWVISIFATLQVIWFTLFFWIAVFQCNPVRRVWDFRQPGTCINWDAYNIVISTWNMTSDVLMLALPMTCIWKLNMKTSIKLSAAGVFIIGALAIAASLLRLIFTIRVLYTKDVTLVLTQIGLCDCAEITAGILSGNFVPLPKFYRYSRDVVRAIRNGDPVRHVRYKGSSNFSSTRSTAGISQMHYQHDSRLVQQQQQQRTRDRDRSDSLTESSLSSELVTFDDLMNSPRVRPSATM